LSKGLEPVRRVVTGVDKDSKSYILEDGVSPAIRKVEARPGYTVSNIWVTGESPSPIDAPDSISAHVGVSPPKRGTVIRVIDFPPEPKNPAEFARMIEATFSNLYPDATHKPDPSRHPGMHKTKTIDYAIVLQGEICAVMDKDETELRAGDILIQRGTNHGWANRSDRICRVAFVLIDAE
jgi:mannose-6-phosphate isomerase-like protein (cupin superfamily)